jgi:hypothetical protein
MVHGPCQENPQSLVGEQGEPPTAFFTPTCELPAQEWGSFTIRMCVLSWARGIWIIGVEAISCHFHSLGMRNLTILGCLGALVSMASHGFPKEANQIRGQAFHYLPSLSPFTPVWILICTFQWRWRQKTHTQKPWVSRGVSIKNQVKHHWFSHVPPNPFLQNLTESQGVTMVLTLQRSMSNHRKIDSQTVRVSLCQQLYPLVFFHSFWIGRFIVELPVKNGDFP